MAGKPVSNEQKLLDAISTLKRATGILNAPKFPDASGGQGFFEAFTTDHESGVILANLISSSMLEALGRKEKFWSKSGRSDFHDDVEVQPHHDNSFRIAVTIPRARIESVARTMNEKAQMLIAPDKKPGRSR